MIRTSSRFPKNEKGVTLVEVLASIVIISIILLGVFSLLTFTNKTAVSNNAKLVSINLAKATIERMKVKPDDYFYNFEELKAKTAEFEVVYDHEDCHRSHEDFHTSESESECKCETLYLPVVNDQTYHVEITVSQTDEERDLKLLNVVVTVSLAERNIKSVVEGYVNYATYENG